MQDFSDQQYERIKVFLYKAGKAWPGLLTLQFFTVLASVVQHLPRRCSLAIEVCIIEMFMSVGSRSVHIFKYTYYRQDIAFFRWLEVLQSLELAPRPLVRIPSFLSSVFFTLRESRVTCWCSTFYNAGECRKSSALAWGVGCTCAYWDLFLWWRMILPVLPLDICMRSCNFYWLKLGGP